MAGINRNGTLKGRNAVVTGASRGIGEAIAARLAMEGANVVVSARTAESGESRLPGTLHDTVERIQRAGGKATFIKADLAQAAERFLQTREIDCYKIELWAKYSGAIDYDQVHHRDYENHTIVVPRADQIMPQMTCFILLSDVTELDGPTKAVPIEKTRHIPLGVTRTEMGEFLEDEVAVTGPAGSILIYKTDVFHRGSNFAAPGRSRFVMPIDFKKRGWRWQGKLAWPDRALFPGWKEAMVKMTPRQRDLFGWPPIGSEYWNAQTLRDVQTRYPDLDLAPYRR